MDLSMCVTRAQTLPYTFDVIDTILAVFYFTAHV